MNIETLLENFYEWLLSRGTKLFFALIILIIGWKIIKKFMKSVESFFNKRNFDPTLHHFLNGFVKLVLQFILILGVLGYIGIDTTAFATVFASIGVAISLGLKESLSNFVGGITLLFLRPFQVGDVVQTANYSGKIDKISMFYTQITTFDNNEILIPNGSIVNSAITNYSLKSTRRLDVTFGVGYECDVHHVKKILAEVVEKNKHILKDPKPFINICEHGDNAVYFLVRVWVKNDDYYPVRFYLLEQTKIRFDEENINIPYPQMDVYLKNK
ncbi:MAG: mechanosensitive ion channel family protein [Clostridium sp.]|nr:mechanosensitive ion channel family protein [Clostridium sp.]